MASNLSNTFRIVYIIGFFFSFFFILSIVDDQLYNLDAISKLVHFLDYIVALLEILIYFLARDIVVPTANTVFSVFAHGITIPYLNITIFGSSADTATVYSEFQAVADWIYPNSAILRTSGIDPVAEILSIYGIFFAVILIVIGLISALGFLTRGNSQLAITSFIAMQGLLIVAGYVPNSANPSGRMLLISLTLPTFGGTLSSFINDFVLLIGSQIFFVGLSLYILLELAFQSSYAINVIDPMVDREKRIKKHLARVDAYRPSRSEMSRGAGSVSLGSSSATVRKYDMLAASYLREMVDKRIFRRGKDVQDEKTTLRLQSYIQSLRRTDRNFEAKITAVSAQPSTFNVVRSVVPLIFFRVILVVIFAFIILNPLPILNLFIANPNSSGGLNLLNFPALIDSIELTQPEFRTVILFNVMALIIVLAGVIHYLLVHKPKVEEKEIKKVSTLVDFQEIKEVVEVSEEEQVESNED
ncbi:MAG: hypothetical protein ACFFD1_02400 [Candidatus Thorarchaeota archaeon]